MAGALNPSSRTVTLKQVSNGPGPAHTYAPTHARTQAADDFSSFLKSENELEAGSGPNFASNRVPSLHQLKPTRSAVRGSTERVRVAAASSGDIEASPERPAATSALSGNDHQESNSDSSARAEPTGSGTAARDERDEPAFGGEEDRNIDDVTRPMRRQAGRSGGGRGQGRTIPGILNKKGASLLEGEGDKFSQLPEDEDGLDARRDHERGEGEGKRRASPVGDADRFGNGVRDPTECSTSPAGAAVVNTGGDVADPERLAFRRQSVDVV